MIPHYGDDVFKETIKIAQGYYNRTYWPERYAERIDVKLDGIDVSAIFSMPPSDSKGRRDFRMRELYNKVYVVPNNSHVQDIIKSVIIPPKEIIQLTQFNDLCVFRDNPNISPVNQFILRFFPDEQSRRIQIEKDEQFYSEHPPVQSTESCTLL